MVVLRSECNDVILRSRNMTGSFSWADVIQAQCTCVKFGKLHQGFDKRCLHFRFKFVGLLINLLAHEAITDRSETRRISAAVEQSDCSEQGWPPLTPLQQFTRPRQSVLNKYCGCFSGNWCWRNLCMEDMWIGASNNGGSFLWNSKSGKNNGNCSWICFIAPDDGWLAHKAQVNIQYTCTCQIDNLQSCTRFCLKNVITHTCAAASVLFMFDSTQPQCLRVGEAAYNSLHSTSTPVASGE